MDVIVLRRYPGMHDAAVVPVAHVAAFAVHGEEPQLPVACTKKRSTAHAMHLPILFQSWKPAAHALASVSFAQAVALASHAAEAQEPLPVAVK